MLQPIRPSHHNLKLVRRVSRALAVPFVVLLVGAAFAVPAAHARQAASATAPPADAAAAPAPEAPVFMAFPFTAPAIFAPASVAAAFPATGSAFPAPGAPQGTSTPSQNDDEFPRPGGHELQVWSGYGSAVIIAHTIPHENVWNLGFRYGWVLTDPGGPGWLRGTFEYAVDVAPMYEIFQRGGNAYGAGFDGFVLKWNLVPHRRIVPYAELTGGAVFTNHDIPAGINDVNFTPQVAFGAHFLRGKYAWSADLRFLHISDAGLTHYNPGIDDIQFRIGFGAFTQPKE